MTHHNKFQIFLFLFCMFLTFNGRAESPPIPNGEPQQMVQQIDDWVKKGTVDKTTRQELIQILQNQDADVQTRERAAWALGELRIQEGVPTLIQAAEHKGLLIRSAALNSLARMRNPAALPTFIEIATKDPILSLRQRATLALGLLKSEKSIPTLVTLSSDPSPEIKGAAALAMATTHSKKNDFSELLKEMATKEEDPYVRARAQMALELVQKKTNTIKTHLLSEDSDVRLFAAFYFLHQGVSADMKALETALNGESNEDVRWALMNSLREIKKRAQQKKKATTAPSKTTQPGAQTQKVPSKTSN